MVQNESIGISVAFMDGKAELQPNELQEIREKRQLLALYGFVRYSDTFSRKHELRFCYVYRPNKGFNNWIGGGFKLGGPKAYNRAT